MRLAVAVLCVGLGLSALAPDAGRAQDIGVVQSDVLVIDPDRLLEETRLGQAMLAEFKERREALIEKNHGIEQALEKEERELTKLRDRKTPEEFRKLADAFDEKVQKIRSENERAVEDIERYRESIPVRFLQEVEPVLKGLLDNANGAVIVDKRSVMLSADVVDITEPAIVRIDEQIGDNTAENPQ